MSDSDEYCTSLYKYTLDIKSYLIVQLLMTLFDGFLLCILIQTCTKTEIDRNSCFNIPYFVFKSTYCACIRVSNVLLGSKSSLVVRVTCLFLRFEVPLAHNVLLSSYLITKNTSKSPLVSILG